MILLLRLRLRLHLRSFRPAGWLITDSEHRFLSTWGVSKRFAGGSYLARRQWGFFFLFFSLVVLFSFESDISPFSYYVRVSS